MNNKNITPEFENLKKLIENEKKIIGEFILLDEKYKNSNPENQEVIKSHINLIKESIENINKEIPKSIEKIILIQPLFRKEIDENFKLKVPEKRKTFVKEINNKIKKVEIKKPEKIEISELEKKTLKRFRKKQEITKEIKIKKPSKYIKLSNVIFSKVSDSLIQEKMFSTLKRDLIKANLQFVPTSYLSMLFLNTVVATAIGFFIFLFFMFFNFSLDYPIITMVSEGMGARFLKVFWIFFAVPLATFAFTYFYPSLEKKAIESKINQELPFATIHMAAISGSMIDPSNIFSIITSTKEYPYLEKEFTKIINEINIYGYDLVSALRNIAFNSPSKKLSELFNGLATTINSGGDLPEFFDKRSQSLLFEHKIEKEKSTKAAETFMDIYISVVIAAPMILMLLLMVMKISGLGISLSVGMISLVMVLGVSMINIVFLTFLYLKQPTE